MRKTCLLSIVAMLALVLSQAAFAANPPPPERSGTAAVCAVRPDKPVTATELNPARTSMDIVVATARSAPLVAVPSPANDVRSDGPAADTRAAAARIFPVRPKYLPPLLDLRPATDEHLTEIGNLTNHSHAFHGFGGENRARARI